MFPVSMDLIRCWTWSLAKAGVLPSWATYLGPRTEAAGLRPMPIELLVGEEVAQGRQVLLLAGCGQGVAVLVVEVVLEVVADQEGRDVAEGDALAPAPVEEAIDGALVRLAGVGGADLGRKKIGIGIFGVAAGVLDDRRRQDLAAEPFEVGVDDRGDRAGRIVNPCRDVNDFGLAVVHGTTVPRFQFMPNNVF
jgi:hypothetical protein